MTMWTIEIKRMLRKELDKLREIRMSDKDDGQILIKRYKELKN